MNFLHSLKAALKWTLARDGLPVGEVRRSSQS